MTWATLPVLFVWFVGTTILEKVLHSEVGSHSLSKGFSSQALFFFSRFWFKASSRLRSSWALFCWAFLRCKTLRRSLSNTAASLSSMRSHLARSLFKAKNLRLAETDLPNCKCVPSFFGRCRFLSSKAICRRSQRSISAKRFISLNFCGRCLFLSSMAICCRPTAPGGQSHSFLAIL